MRLDAVVAAYHKHRVIEHLQNTFGLGRKVDMTGSVEQGDLEVACAENSLARKDGDSAFTLEPMGIERGIAVIDSAEAS